MSKGELVQPSPDFGGFQEEIFYPDGLTPTEMAGRTVDIIDAYFRNDPYWPQISTFLSKQTLSFVRSARQGFLDNPQAVRKLALINPSDADAYVQMNNRNDEDPPRTDDSEAFSRIYLAFGYMPKLSAKIPGFNSEFSSIHMIEPPFTTAEVLGRIHEVGVTVLKFVEKRVNPDASLINMPGVLRTYWTFRAMRSMPLSLNEPES